MTLKLRKGEILALAGDNGAGKTTLIKCLAGAHQPDKGTIAINSNTVNINNPQTAKDLGIETTFQDLAVVGNLSVAQNIFLGRENTMWSDKLFSILDRSGMQKKANDLLSELGVDIDPSSTVGNLSGGERQLVAISRTLISDPEIVIMDEPTSALSVEGTEQVLDLIRQMQQQGISIVIISHNIDHVLEISDRIHVMYNGQSAGTLDPTSVSRDDIATRMIAGTPEEEVVGHN